MGLPAEVVEPRPAREGQCVCPRCGTSFEPIKVYSIQEIARNLGVAKGTVSGWMSKGQLTFRLWARSHRSIKRVVLGRDMMMFMEQRYPLPDPDGLHLAQRLWNWTLRNGRKGQDTMQANRRAKLQAQSSSTDEPSS